MPTAQKTVGKFIEYLIVRSFNFSLGLIPFRLRAWLTEQLGISLYYIAGRYRRLVMRHLEQAFPESEEAWRRDITKQNFRNMGRLIAEIMQTPRVSDAFFRRWFIVKPDDEAHRKVFADGGIAILGHFGNWEWHGVLAARLGGKDIQTLVKRHTNYWSNEYLERTRNKAGMRLVYVDQNPFVIIKMLRRGEFVAFTADQDARQSGEFVPFMGELASTFTGPAIVARNSDAPVYFVWSHHDEKKRLVFEYELLERPTGIDPVEDYEEWEYAFTLAWTRKMEEKIREHPADYLWAHNRWKTRPEDLEAVRARLAEHGVEF